MIWIESVEPFEKPLKNGTGCTQYHMIKARTDEDFEYVKNWLIERDYYIAKNMRKDWWSRKLSVLCNTAEWRKIRKALRTKVDNLYFS